MTRPPNPELPRRILDAAEEIIAAEGHEALNMRRLAEGVGITPTTLYYYFKSKDHILVRLKLRAADRLNEQVRRIELADPRQAIRDLGEAYLSFAEEHPQMYRLFTEKSLDRSLYDEDDYDNRLHYAYHAAQSGLESLASRGLYRYDPRERAMTGWILLHGFVSLFVAGTLESITGLDRSELKAVFLDIYMDTVDPVNYSADGNSKPPQ